MKERLKKYLPAILSNYLRVVFFFSPKRAVRKAYTIFCTPRKGKIIPEQKDFLEEAEDEVILLHDNYLQTYRWANMGETVLLIHGWESNTHRWKELIKKLHKIGYNIIAFDAPAHGKSSGKIFNVPMYTESLQKVIEYYRPNYLIGHSVGGMTALYHQYIYQNEEIEKLIILAPPGELSRIMKDYQKILKLSPKFMTGLDRYFKEKHGFYFKEFSIPEFAKKIEQKGLLIHDKYDDIAPYQESEAIAKNWNNATFIITENFGHSLSFKEVHTSIIDFLKD